MPWSVAGIPVANPYGLGALSPEDATEQIFPQARVGSGPGHDATTRGYILSSAQAAASNSGAFTTAYQPGSSGCAGVSLAKPLLTGTVGGLALKFAPQAFAAGPIVGGIVLAVAGISELFSVIFGHHAAAVAKERSILCAAVPAANQSLELIDQAVQNGQATPQDAIAALSAVVAGFRQAVGPIIKGADPTSSQCNAACENLSELRAYVLVKQSMYQDMISASSSSLPAVGASVSRAVASIPSWLLWAAGAYLAWELL